MADVGTAVIDYLESKVPGVLFYRNYGPQPRPSKYVVVDVIDSQAGASITCGGPPIVDSYVGITVFSDNIMEAESISRQILDSGLAGLVGIQSGVSIRGARLLVAPRDEVLESDSGHATPIIARIMTFVVPHVVI